MFMEKQTMDEAELELKFEAILREADDWWDKAEPEKRVEAYFDYLKKKEKEVDAGDEDG